MPPQSRAFNRVNARRTARCFVLGCVCTTAVLVGCGKATTSTDTTADAAASVDTSSSDGSTTGADGSTSGTGKGTVHLKFVEVKK